MTARSFIPSFAPAYSPAYSPTQGRRGEGSSLPFSFTAQDTYWFDGTWSGNTVNEVGDDTIAAAPDRVSGKGTLVNITKDYQLLENANGFEGQAGDSRGLGWEDGDVSGFANGHNGCYIAANIYPISTDYYIFGNGRFSLYVPSNREVGFKHTFDGGGFNWALRAPAISLSAWRTIEILMDYDNDTATFWYNGVEQSLAYDAGEAYSPSSTDQNASLVCGEGITQQVIYHDELIATDSDIRTSISSYLNSVRPT